MSSIAENISAAREVISDAVISSGRRPDEVTLLAATKFQPVDKILQAIEAGVDAIGENRVQEFTAKEPFCGGVPNHFIGHLQRNKLKHIVGKVALIHSLDSLELGREISAYAVSQGIYQDVLLEINIAHEDTKGGFYPEETERALDRLRMLPGLRIRGLMCMPPMLTDNNRCDIEKYFLQTKQIGVDITPKVLDNNVSSGNLSKNGQTVVLSMGTSQDFALAVKCGSTLVRLGSVIFGARQAPAL